MPTILLTNRYEPGPMRIIEDLVPEGFELITLKEVNQQALLEKAASANYLMYSGNLLIDKEVLAAAVNLRMVQRTGVGYENVDLEALKERGIPFYVNQGINAGTMAEHTLMLILAVLRHLVVLDTSMREGRWLKHGQAIKNRDLEGKTVGLVGLGNIGQEVARRLTGFGVKTIYAKRTPLPAALEKELEIRRVTLPELLKKADIISLHLPLGPETKALIGTRELAAMKRGAVLINTARGGLIDEQALVEALRSQHLAGAGLDVFAEEPPKPDNPLLQMNNVVITPHLGGLTLEVFKKMMAEAFRGIELFAAGETSAIEPNRIC